MFPSSYVHIAGIEIRPERISRMDSFEYKGDKDVMKQVVSTPVPKEQAAERASFYVNDKLGNNMGVVRELHLEETEEGGERDWVTQIIAPIPVGEIVISSKTGEVRRCPTPDMIEQIKKGVKLLVERVVNNTPIRNAS